MGFKIENDFDIESNSLLVYLKGIYPRYILLPCFQVHKFLEVSNLVRQQKVFVLTVSAYT